MNNVYTKPGSTPVDIGFKNNTYAELSSGLDAVEAGIETDTGLFAFKNHAGAYKRCAPKSALTNLKVPVCKDSTTGECEDSVIYQTASSVQINNAGTDRDLIVSGVSDPNGLYYDAALKRVGIGEGTPPYKLSILDANPVISLKDSDTDGIALINAASSTGSLYIDADAFDTVATSKLHLRVDGANCIEIDESGNVVVSQGNLTIPENKGLYFAASGTDITSVGTLRMTKSGNDILTERWDGANWV